jgi:endonuclease YncB( thermonuclease family)
MTRVFAAALLAACSFAAGAAPAASGKVTRVIDGQTVMLQRAEGAPVQVQLAGIVAPALCQPWGPEARDALKELVFQLNVSVRDPVTDRSGRLTGELMLDKVDIGSRMVEEGNAWSVRTKWDRGPWVKQERVAKALGRGLHAMAGVQAPRPGQPRPVCP